MRRVVTFVEFGMQVLDDASDASSYMNQAVRTYIIPDKTRERSVYRVEYSTDLFIYMYNGIF